MHRGERETRLAVPQASRAEETVAHVRDPLRAAEVAYFRVRNVGRKSVLYELELEPVLHRELVEPGELGRVDVADAQARSSGHLGLHHRKQRRLVQTLASGILGQLMQHQHL